LHKIKTIFETVRSKIKLLESDGLKAKGARGVLMLASGNVVDGGMRLLRNMILARILAPAEFGLMAIALVFTMAFEAFSEVGIKQAVIQNKRGADQEFLNIAWWAQAVRGFALYGVAFLLSPAICSFYSKPELLVVMRFIFTVIIFRGVLNPRTYVLEREYKFGWAVLLLQGSGVIGTVTTIVLAFYINNVWSLAIGYVVENAVRCLASYVFLPFMPSFRLDKECIRLLAGFGAGMFGLPILTLVSSYIDIFVLGKVVSDSDLGFYSLASTLAIMPVDLFSKVISPVLLPLFSAKQDNKSSLQRGVLRINQMIAFFGLPVVALMVGCAREIMILAYTSKYEAVSAVFAVLSTRILIQPGAIVLASVYLAVGKPHLHRAFVLLRVGIIVLAIYPAVLYFGGIGAASVIVGGNILAMILQVYWCRRVIEMDFVSYLSCYKQGILFSMPVIAVVVLLKALGIFSPLTVFLISFAVLVLVMIAAASFMLAGNKSPLVSAGINPVLPSA
jgi:lipopolysaccharide exporter